MSSFTFADNKLGGRLVAACDALGAGHLNRAAGIFSEIADDLNQEATQLGLLAPDEDDWSAPLPQTVGFVDGEGKPVGYNKDGQLLFERMKQVSQTVDLQSCSRNVHAFGPPDPVSGWRTCAACGTVNVAPPPA